MLPRIAFTFAFAFACCWGVGNAQAVERPNVVVFIADDVGWNDFGCTGSPSARTPNIDRLAQEGLRFTNYFLTASSCSPSRCSIITGRYPHNNGDAGELHRPLSEHLVKFPKLLKQAGYYTALSGKDHMPQKMGREAEVWDLVTKGKAPGNSGGEGEWLEVVENRPKDKPFFFWFAAFDAHRGWDGDREWQADQFGPKHDASQVALSPFLTDAPATRSDWASYHNEITRFDWHIGQVTAELKRQNVLDDTLIVVTSDNGAPFPRGKTRVHDSGMKAPFVLHWPKRIRRAAGQGETKPATCTALLSAVDLCPTVLGLAQVAVPEQVQGVDFSPLLADPSKSVRKYAFSEHNWHDYEAHGRAVRDAEGNLYVRNARPEKAWLGPADSIGSPSHKDLQKALAAGLLTKPQSDVFLQPRPAEELYAATDPLQIENLIPSEAHAAKLAELRRVMDLWQAETGDSAPADFSPDFFDRETGYADRKSGKSIGWPPPMKTAPGSDRGADRINRPGPR